MEKLLPVGMIKVAGLSPGMEAITDNGGIALEELRGMMRASLQICWNCTQTVHFVFIRSKPGYGMHFNFWQ